METIETYRHHLPPFAVLSAMSDSELNVLCDFHCKMRELAEDCDWVASEDFYADNVEILIAIIANRNAEYRNSLGGK